MFFEVYKIKNMHVPWMSIDKQPQVYAAHLLLMRDFNEALNAMTSEKSHEAWMLFAQVKLGHMWMVGLLRYMCSAVVVSPMLVGSGDIMCYGYGVMKIDLFL